MNTQKTTKLTFIKNSLDNIFDPTVILENDYFRVRLVYKDDNVPAGSHVKERFTFDVFAKDVAQRSYAPYLSGNYENPMITIKSAFLTADKVAIYKELLDALYLTIDEIKNYLDENY